MIWVKRPSLGSKKVFRINGSIQIGTAYNNFESKLTITEVNAITPTTFRKINVISRLLSNISGR